MLHKAEEIIQVLPKNKYNHIEKPYFESCLGKHIRHILDHYLCFSRDLSSGTIDYDRRQRNAQLETDKGEALSTIQSICAFLQDLQKREVNDAPLRIQLCSDAGEPKGAPTDSSIARELQFLQGHSVHHYALIATMLKFYDVPVSRDFGIAPSTLAHEESVAPPA